jgi:DNA invertase Pin-like site-specific DNA recombinase
LDHYFIGIDGKRKPLYGYNISRGGGAYPAISGEEHGSFIKLDQDTFKELLKRGFSAEEIAREFDISIPTLINKIKFYWKYLGIENVHDARAYFGGNQAFLDRFGTVAKSVVGVELNIPKLIDFIDQGLFLSELEEEFKTSFSTITNHLQKIGFKNLTEARIRLGVMENFKKKWIQKKCQLHYGVTIIKIMLKLLNQS